MLYLLLKTIIEEGQEIKLVDQLKEENLDQLKNNLKAGNHKYVVMGKQSFPFLINKNGGQKNGN